MEERFFRNMPALTKEEQGVLKHSRVAVIGCGGIGGYVIEHLLRLGAGHILAADGDVFTQTNLNRQLYALPETLGKNKAQAAKERARTLAPDTEFTAVTGYFTEENAASILKDADIVIDALDSVKTRLLLEKAAADRGIYLVHGAAEGWEAQAMLVAPGSGVLKKLYGSGEREEPSPSVLSFAPALSASMETALAVRQLVRPGSVPEGELYCFSLETMRFSSLPLL